MGTFNSGGFDEFDELEDEEPFGQEFNRDDVVFSKADIDDDEDSLQETVPDVDIDSILNYDEERRKSDHFEKDFVSDEEGKEQDEILQKNFRDYLVARKISGKLEGIGSDSRIPAERINDSAVKVEIRDDPGHEVKDNKKTTIVVLRNDDGEITGIEVLCSCGEKTTLSIAFGEDETVESEDVDLMEQDGIPDVGLDEKFAGLDAGEGGLTMDISGEEDGFSEAT